MPDRLEPAQQPLPVSNYASAVARAVEWLGDRYLLARPINAGMRPSRYATQWVGRGDWGSARARERGSMR
jgi:hypothetical protein